MVNLNTAYRRLRIFLATNGRGLSFYHKLSFLMDFWFA